MNNIYTVYADDTQKHYTVTDGILSGEVARILADNNIKYTSVNGEKIKDTHPGAVLVHIYRYPNDWKPENEIKTRNYNKVFQVYTKNGMPGIDWNAEQSPYTNRGEVFTPLNSFSGTTVCFEEIDTGIRYHHNNITNQIEVLKEDRP